MCHENCVTIKAVTNLFLDAQSAIVMTQALSTIFPPSKVKLVKHVSSPAESLYGSCGLCTHTTELGVKPYLAITNSNKLVGVAKTLLRPNAVQNHI